MVNLVEDWEVLEEYAGDKQGFYQILGDAESVKIRVAIGRLGFKKEFENKGGTLLNRILAFCKSRRILGNDSVPAGDGFYVSRQTMHPYRQI